MTNGVRGWWQGPAGGSWCQGGNPDPGQGRVWLLQGTREPLAAPRGHRGSSKTLVSQAQELWDTQPCSHPWQFPPQRMDGAGPDPVPCFASLPPSWAVGGLWDGLGTGMGTKGLGAGGHAPGGQEGVALPRKVQSCPSACFSPTGIGVLEAQGGCTPQQGPGAPVPTQPLSPPPHTRAPMAPTHNLGRVLLCRQRNTPG